MKQGVLRRATMTVMAAAMLFSTTGCGQNQTSSASQTNSSQEQTEIRTIKFAVTAPPGEIICENALKWADLVNERSDGRYNIEVYHSAVLGSDVDCVPAVQNGSLDMACCSSSNLSSFCPAFSPIELPYILSSDKMDGFYDALDNGELGTYFTEELEKISLVPIMFGDGGWRRWETVADTPITCAEDFKGIKLRTTSSVIDNQLVQALGASPVTLGIADCYTGLSQGTVDGLGLPYATIVANGWHEIVKNVFVTDYNYYLDPFLINKDLWDSLPAEDQQLFLECGQEATEWGRVEMWNLDEEYEQVMKEAGVQFHEPTEEEKQKLYDLGQAVWESMSDSIDQKALELILATQQ